MIGIEELTEMIERGWGNTPREKLPPDWRDCYGPDPEARRHRVKESQRIAALKNRAAQDSGKWIRRRRAYLREKGLPYDC